MRERLTGQWYRESPRASVLQPLGWLYAALVRVRRDAYRRGWLARHAVGKPVVVVGNLTVGGTGKTPLTIWLARELSATGIKVGIVSRGYGRCAAAVRTVEPGLDWRQVGDEALLLARGSGCLTVVAADRVAGARALVAGGVDVIVADDGLQHLRLARDFEIVVIDGARGFGNGRLLPAGPLREPAARLAQADLVVVNGAAEHASLAASKRAQGAVSMWLESQHALRLDAGEPPRALLSFCAQRVHAVAGIGNPGRFFRQLRAQGIEVLEHPFPDHHPFSAADLAFADQLPVLMTEKDAVKCTSFADPRLWYVPVTACFSASEARELTERVLTRVRAATNADPGGN